MRIAFLQKKRRHIASGFTLIEALVLLFLFGIATTTFYRAYTAAALQIIEAKRRTAAVALVNERMEQMRNVPYDDIAVVGGSPSGLLSPDEVVEVNGITFRLVMNVRFIDDPNDGLGSDVTDPDTDFDDYKRVKIFAAWGEATDDSTYTTTDVISNTFSRRRIDITSTFTPPGGLEGPTDNGLLSVNTISADGGIVENVPVRIQCDNCDNGLDVDFVDSTDSLGNFIQSVPPSSGGIFSSANYVITLDKPGYEVIVTELPFDGVTQLYSPANEHLTVISGELTTATFVMNPISDFTVAVRDPFCNPLPTAGPYTFTLQGGRVMGTDPSVTPSENVYAIDDFLLNHAFTTDATGEAIIRSDTDGSGVVDAIDQSGFGEYIVDEVAFELAYPDLTFWKLVPGDEARSNTVQVEDAIVNCNFIVVDENVPGAFLTILDVDDPTNIINLEGATIRLQNIELGYSATLETDVFGLGYFPTNATESLVSGTYEIKVSHDGYDDFVDLITIGSGLEVETINMTR